VVAEAAPAVPVTEAAPPLPVAEAAPRSPVAEATLLLPVADAAPPSPVAVAALSAAVAEIAPQSPMVEAARRLSVDGEDSAGCARSCTQLTARAISSGRLNSASMVTLSDAIVAVSSSDRSIAPDCLTRKKRLSAGG
jgi:hypothetical protein